MKVAHVDAVVTALNVFPIKSCQGIPLKRMPITITGPEHDRQWMVIDEAGKFLTQRTFPRLATVQVRLEAGGLVLDAPGMPSIIVDDGNASPELVTAQVWSDQVAGRTHSRRTDEWFSKVLGVGCRLVRPVTEDARKRKKTFPEIGETPFVVNFPDSAPFLLANEASLSNLASRAGEDVPMERFRANIVVAASEAWVEDRWTSLKIGNIEFPALYACDRCTITMTDQSTGRRFPEPMKTLGTFRKFDGRILFGMRMIHRGTGVIHVGDSVTVTRST